MRISDWSSDVCSSDIDDEQKAIYVIRARGGVPPMFAGGGGRVHTRARQRMRELLETAETPVYLDEVAQRFLHEARQASAQPNLTTAHTLTPVDRQSVM